MLSVKHGHELLLCVFWSGLIVLSRLIAVVIQSEDIYSVILCHLAVSIIFDVIWMQYDVICDMICNEM